MSRWTRLTNVFRSERVDRDIGEELQSHLDEAQADGRPPGQVLRAFGSRLRIHEAARETLIAHWLESLMADVISGWRQIVKHKTVSASAILSLALGIGSCMSAFRLIDALFLRPLPIAQPERFYVITWESYSDGKFETGIDRFDYPALRSLRAAAIDDANVMAISIPMRIDLTFGSDENMERASRQYVSGEMFGQFGLKPAFGRLLSESDDLTPGSHPYAVISWDYWSRRFARDPGIIGRSFRIGNDLYEIIGVAPKGFTGTDPGTFTDVFIPDTMSGPFVSGTCNCFRMWVSPKPGGNLARIQEKLRAALHRYREEQVKTWTAGRQQQEKDVFLKAQIALEPAGNGRSGTQHGYQRSLTIFAVLVGLVLLIACGNMANLMTAQAGARSREMALRVSIGAGRSRLIQLVLIESAILAAAASALGLAFSWLAAPFVLGRLNPPDDPVRLALNADWLTTLFAVALTFMVTMLFGLVPAFRASSIKPAAALKGGADPHGRRRLMNALVAAQVAFCLFVLFVSGLFISTFERMANQPTGFSSPRVLALESVSKTGLAAEEWYQLAQRLQSTPGVKSAAVAQYALMSNNAMTRFVWANGHAPDGTWSHSTWILGVSPGWFETMKLGILQGRDFRWDDAYPDVAVVNEKFAQRYFGDESPVGRTFEAQTFTNGDARVRMRIVGVVPDARYEDMRLPVPATAYLPLRGFDGGVERNHNRATFLVRTRTPDPLAMAATLRRMIHVSRPDIRVANIVTQEELVRSQMVRERLLAALSLFFAAVALILAGVGLYGVLNYAVLERRRELGIRIALGAPSVNIAARVTLLAFAMVVIGASVGIGFGLASERYITALLYQVRVGEPSTLVLPLATMLGALALAALPPVVRAIRIDPAELLRAE